MMLLRYNTHMNSHTFRAMIVAILTLLVWMNPVSVFAAELKIDSTKKILNNGDTFIANVRIGVDNECINTASVDVLYDPAVFDVVDFSQGESLITLWIEEPIFSEERGVIHFA